MPLKISVLFVLLLCSTSLAARQNVGGLWAGAIEADEVFAAVRLNFDEAKIVLSFAGSERAGAIKDLKIDGGEISFLADLHPKAKFYGKFENGVLIGAFDILRGDGTKSGSGVFAARRVESFAFESATKATPSAAKIELPEPSGAFAVGRRFFYWTDETRAETITDAPDDKRKLFVQLWYPAKKQRRRAAAYYPNVEKLRASDAELFRSIKTHAFDDAEIASSKMPFPVIVFSPGLGSSPFNYTAIIEDLVSRGYVVAAINHPFDSGDFVFSDGQIVRFADSVWNREISKDWTADQRRNFFDERRFGWARDVSFVVDRLEKLEKPFKGRLDLRNLGMLGHSFGGQAASIVCASDARFKACANLDGMAQGNVILPNEKGETMKQPFLFFNKSAEVTDAELGMMNLSRDQYRARESRRIRERWKPSFKKQLAENEAGAYFVLYPGIKHSSFSDSLQLDAKDVLFADRHVVARNINDYILAFFDKFLMSKPAPLLDDANRSRAPLIVEFFKKNK